MRVSKKEVQAEFFSNWVVWCKEKEYILKSEYWLSYKREWYKNVNVSKYDVYSLLTLNSREIKWLVKWILDIERFEKKHFEILDWLLDQARIFLKNSLSYDSIPKEVFNFKIKDKTSLDDFLWKAYSDKKNVKFWPVVCALLKIMDAIYDTESKEFTKFEWETAFLREKIEKEYLIKDWNFYEPWVDSNSYNLTKFKISSRWKEKDRVVWKLLMKSDYDLESVVKDWIWMQLEFENEEELEIWFIFFMRRLARERACNFLFKNKNFKDYSEEDFAFFNDILWVKFKIEEDTNFKSDASYKAIHLRWKIEVPSWWIVWSAVRKKPFEIKFVLLDNKNESKFWHHSIYEMKQKISIVSRLFWYFSENYLNKVIALASEESWVLQDEIMKHLITDIDFIRDFKYEKSNSKRFMTTENLARIVWTPMLPGPIENVIDTTHLRSEIIAS